MKKVTVQSRATIFNVIGEALIFAIIVGVIWIILVIFKPDSDLIMLTEKIGFWGLILVIWLNIKSMLNKKLYLSDVVFCEDEIRFVYKKGNKQEDVKIIKKQDIKEFNLASYVHLVSRGQAVVSVIQFNLDIILNNNETINITDETFSSLRQNSSYLFIKALLENKKEIPNFNFTQGGEGKAIIEDFNRIYTTGKGLSYFEKLSYRIKELPIILKIFLILGIIIIIGFIILSSF